MISHSQTNLKMLLPCSKNPATMSQASRVANRWYRPHPFIDRGVWSCGVFALGGRVRAILGLGLAMILAGGGCAGGDRPPQPARVPGPQERQMASETQSAKPLPGQSPTEIPPPSFNDAPLVSQDAPETARFVEAYNKVGRPRLVVWVTGTPTGYDEGAGRSIDYAAVQTILSDWLSAGGHVAIISPEAAHQALSPQQQQNLSSGQGINGKEISNQVHADVLVAVRGEVTHQTSGGPAVRLVADASNLAGGESIGRAVIDIPPPLDEPQINSYTRFMARKLMVEMTGAWTAFGENPPTTAPH
jgi:hypothetical protein